MVENTIQLFSVGTDLNCLKIHVTICIHVQAILGELRVACILISAQLGALELLMLTLVLTCSMLKMLELPCVEWLCVRRGSMMCVCVCVYVSVKLGLTVRVKHLSPDTHTHTHSSQAGSWVQIKTIRHG